MLRGYHFEKWRERSNFATNREFPILPQDTSRMDIVCFMDLKFYDNGVMKLVQALLGYHIINDE